MCWNLEQVFLLCGFGWLAEELEVRSQSESRHILPQFWSAFLSAEFSEVGRDGRSVFSKVSLTLILCFPVTRWFLQHSPPPLSAVRKKTTCCLLWAWTTWATPATWTASCRWARGAPKGRFWLKSVYSGCSIKGISLQQGNKDAAAGNVCPVVVLIGKFFSFHTQGSSLLWKILDLCVPGDVQSCVDYKCAFMCGIISYSTYSHVFNCCFQVLYFCPGFKTGVKHLYNIISKKRESSKDEGEQKAEKVTNPPLFSICNLASQAVLNAVKI